MTSDHCRRIKTKPAQVNRDGKEWRSVLIKSHSCSSRKQLCEKRMLSMFSKQWQTSISTYHFCFPNLYDTMHNRPLCHGFLRPQLLLSV
ncbi:unnamed protein product, partial [Ranitomeya imitator]